MRTGSRTALCWPCLITFALIEGMPRIIEMLNIVFFADFQSAAR